MVEYNTKSGFQTAFILGSFIKTLLTLYINAELILRVKSEVSEVSGSKATSPSANKSVFEPFPQEPSGGFRLFWSYGH